MRHKKYESIDGAWNKKFMSYLEGTPFVKSDVAWVVTEKIHGSNFAFYMDQDEERLGKRNSFIKEGENFFQCLRMTQREAYKIREMWDYLALDYECEELIVYGELCGGNYPHPDVQRPSTVKAIQKGVYYAPDVEFVVFDIYFNGEFMDYYHMVHCCEKVGLHHVLPLFLGTFYECLQYSNEFPSTIHEYFDLPPIENNFCEGIVIKPVEPKYFDNSDRVMVKSKNDKFREIERAPAKKRKTQSVLSDYAMETLALVEPYINENRLNSVLSKFGDYGKKDFKDILLLFLEDVYKDFKINHDNLLNMSDDDQRYLNKAITRQCVGVWRPIYLSETK